LAQQNPETEARMLALSKPIRIIQSDSVDTLQARFGRDLRDGLYFIGLAESHVGYLYKKQGTLIAIHSDYMVPNICVSAQLFQESIYPAFGTYYIADLTWNDELVGLWLSGARVNLK
jgi:hypothetical protein